MTHYVNPTNEKPGRFYGQYLLGDTMELADDSIWEYHPEVGWFPTRLGTVVSIRNPLTGMLEYSSGTPLNLQGSRYPMPTFDAAISKVNVGAGNARVLFCGDSTMIGAWATGVALTNNANKSWAKKLVAKLGVPYIAGSIYGDQGASVGQSGGAKDTTFKAYDPRVIYDSTWAIALGYCIGAFVFQSGSTSRGTFTFAPGISHDTVDVYYTTSNSSAYGSFTVDIGGGVLATVNCNTGTSGVGKTTVTVTAGVNTVNVTKSTDGFVQIRGISCYNNNASIQTIIAGWNAMQGSRVLNGGSGTETANGPTADFPVIAPHLTLICYGINDSTASADTALFTSQIQRIVDFAKQTGDAVLCVPNPLNTTANPNQETYWKIIRELASVNNLNILDFSERLKDWATADANDLMYDNRHPLAEGYDLMATQVKASGIFSW